MVIQDLLFGEDRLQPLFFSGHKTAFTKTAWSPTLHSDKIDQIKLSRIQSDGANGECSASSLSIGKTSFTESKGESGRPEKDENEATTVDESLSGGPAQEIGSEENTGGPPEPDAETGVTRGGATKEDETSVSKKATAFAKTNFDISGSSNGADWRAGNLPEPSEQPAEFTRALDIFREATNGGMERLQKNQNFKDMVKQNISELIEKQIIEDLDNPKGSKNRTFSGQRDIYDDLPNDTTEPDGHSEVNGSTGILQDEDENTSKGGEVVKLDHSGSGQMEGLAELVHGMYTGLGRPGDNKSDLYYARHVFVKRDRDDQKDRAVQLADHRSAYNTFLKSRAGKMSPLLQKRGAILQKIGGLKDANEHEVAYKSAGILRTVRRENGEGANSKIRLNNRFPREETVQEDNVQNRWEDQQNWRQVYHTNSEQLLSNPPIKFRNLMNQLEKFKTVPLNGHQEYIVYNSDHYAKVGMGLYGKKAADTDQEFGMHVPIISAFDYLMYKRVIPVGSEVRTTRGPALPVVDVRYPYSKPALIPLANLKPVQQEHCYDIDDESSKMNKKVCDEVQKTTGEDPILGCKRYQICYFPYTISDAALRQEFSTNGVRKMEIGEIQSDPTLGANQVQTRMLKVKQQNKDATDAANDPEKAQNEKGQPKDQQGGGPRKDGEKDQGRAKNDAAKLSAYESGTERVRTERDQNGSQDTVPRDRRAHTISMKYRNAKSLDDLFGALEEAQSYTREKIGQRKRKPDILVDETNSHGDGIKKSSFADQRSSSKTSYSSEGEGGSAGGIFGSASGSGVEGRSPPAAISGFSGSPPDGPRKLSLELAEWLKDEVEKSAMAKVDHGLPSIEAPQFKSSKADPVDQFERSKADGPQVEVFRVGDTSLGSTSNTTNNQSMLHVHQKLSEYFMKLRLANAQPGVSGSAWNNQSDPAYKKISLNNEETMKMKGSLEALIKEFLILKQQYIQWRSERWQQNIKEMKSQENEGGAKQTGFNVASFPEKSGFNLKTQFPLRMQFPAKETTEDFRPFPTTAVPTPKTAFGPSKENAAAKSVGQPQAPTIYGITFEKLTHSNGSNPKGADSVSKTGVMNAFRYMEQLQLKTLYEDVRDFENEKIRVTIENHQRKKGGVGHSKYTIGPVGQILTKDEINDPYLNYSNNLVDHKSLESQNTMGSMESKHLQEHSSAEEMESEMQDIDKIWDDPLLRTTRQGIERWLTDPEDGYQAYLSTQKGSTPGEEPMVDFLADQGGQGGADMDSEDSNYSEGVAKKLYAKRKEVKQLQRLLFETDASREKEEALIRDEVINSGAGFDRIVKIYTESPEITTLWDITRRDLRGLSNLPLITGVNEEDDWTESMSIPKLLLKDRLGSDFGIKNGSGLLFSDSAGGSHGTTKKAHASTDPSDAIIEQAEHEDSEYFEDKVYNYIQEEEDDDHGASSDTGERFFGTISDHKTKDLGKEGTGLVLDPYVWSPKSLSTNKRAIPYTDLPEGDYGGLAVSYSINIRKSSKDAAVSAGTKKSKMHPKPLGEEVNYIQTFDQRRIGTPFNNAEMNRTVSGSENGREDKRDSQYSDQTLINHFLKKQARIYQNMFRHAQKRKTEILKEKGENTKRKGDFVEEDGGIKDMPESVDKEQAPAESTDSGMTSKPPDGDPDPTRNGFIKNSASAARDRNSDSLAMENRGSGSDMKMSLLEKDRNPIAMNLVPADSIKKTTFLQTMRKKSSFAIDPKVNSGVTSEVENSGLESSGVLNTNKSHSNRKDGPKSAFVNPNPHRKTFFSPPGFGGTGTPIGSMPDGPDNVTLEELDEQIKQQLPTYGSVHTPRHADNANRSGKPSIDLLDYRDAIIEKLVSKDWSHKEAHRPSEMDASDSQRAGELNTNESGQKHRALQEAEDLRARLEEPSDLKDYIDDRNTAVEKLTAIDRSWTKDNNRSVENLNNYLVAPREMSSFIAVLRPKPVARRISEDFGPAQRGILKDLIMPKSLTVDTAAPFLSGIPMDDMSAMCFSGRRVSQAKLPPNYSLPEFMNNIVSKNPERFPKYTGKQAQTAFPPYYVKDLITHASKRDKLKAEIETLEKSQINDKDSILHKAVKKALEQLIAQKKKEDDKKENASEEVGKLQAKLNLLNSQFLKDHWKNEIADSGKSFTLPIMWSVRPGEMALHKEFPWNVESCYYGASRESRWEDDDYMNLHDAVHAYDGEKHNVPGLEAEVMGKQKAEFIGNELHRTYSKELRRWFGDRRKSATKNMRSLISKRPKFLTKQKGPETDGELSSHATSALPLEVEWSGRQEPMVKVKPLVKNVLGMGKVFAMNDGMMSNDGMKNIMNYGKYNETKNEKVLKGRPNPHRAAFVGRWMEKVMAPPMISKVSIIDHGDSRSLGFKKTLDHNKSLLGRKSEFPYHKTFMHGYTSTSNHVHESVFLPRGIRQKLKFKNKKENVMGTRRLKPIQTREFHPFFWHYVSQKVSEGLMANQENTGEHPGFFYRNYARELMDYMREIVRKGDDWNIDYKGLERVVEQGSKGKPKYPDARSDPHSIWNSRPTSMEKENKQTDANKDANEDANEDANKDAIPYSLNPLGAALSPHYFHIPKVMRNQLIKDNHGNTDFLLDPSRHPWIDMRPTDHGLFQLARLHGSAIPKRARVNLTDTAKAIDLFAAKYKKGNDKVVTGHPNAGQEEGSLFEELMKGDGSEKVKDGIIKEILKELPKKLRYLEIKLPDGTPTRIEINRDMVFKFLEFTKYFNLSNKKYLNNLGNNRIVNYGKKKIKSLAGSAIKFVKKQTPNFPKIKKNMNSVKSAAVSSKVKRLMEGKLYYNFLYLPRERSPDEIRLDEKDEIRNTENKFFGGKSASDTALSILENPNNGETLLPDKSKLIRAKDLRYAHFFNNYSGTLKSFNFNIFDNIDKVQNEFDEELFGAQSVREQNDANLFQTDPANLLSSSEKDKGSKSKSKDLPPYKNTILDVGGNNGTGKNGNNDLFYSMATGRDMSFFGFSRRRPKIWSYRHACDRDLFQTEGVKISPSYLRTKSNNRIQLRKDTAFRALRCRDWSSNELELAQKWTGDKRIMKDSQSMSGTDSERKSSNGQIESSMQWIKVNRYGDSKGFHPSAQKEIENSIRQILKQKSFNDKFPVLEAAKKGRAAAVAAQSATPQVNANECPPGTRKKKMKKGGGFACVRTRGPRQNMDQGTNGAKERGLEMGGL